MDPSMAQDLGDSDHKKFQHTFLAPLRSLTEVALVAQVM